MNGNDKLQVPITTLAGTLSLTELLPELTLPTVIGEQSKSLLFHPRVEEEAQRHLNCKDPQLAKQLAEALASTSANHIQLKDQYYSPKKSLNPSTSPLLQAILKCNPNVFSGDEKPIANHVNTFTGFDSDSGPSKSRTPKINVNHVKKEEVSSPQPVVKLMKLSKDEIKQLANSSSKSSKGHSRSGREVTVKSKFKEESSDSEEDKYKKPVKIFKGREKEREEKKRKDRADRKRNRAEDNDYDPEVERKKMKRAPESDEDYDDIDDEEYVANSSTKTPSKTHSARKAEYNRKKIERKLGSKEKLSNEELMETGVYQRFTRLVEKIFDNVEDLELTAEIDDEEDIPQEFLIAKHDLATLCSESAKLKSLGAMALVPPERLVRLLHVLEKNIRDGSRITPIVDDEGSDEDKLYVELVMERILRSVDAALSSLYILTSANMSKRVYLEDVIEKCFQFAKFQLHNTIYPSFDPVYRVDNKDGYIGTFKKKRAHAKDVRDRNILALYNKLNELVSLISDLLIVQQLTDTSVLLLSSLGVAPFFVENVPELQLSSLKLVTQVFSKYDKHRKLLIDDILASIARLPSSKRSLRSYRLNSDEHIQMLTALVLQLIQCVVELPDNLGTKKEDGKNAIDRDVLVSHKYENAMATAYSFLTVFLQKTGNKNEEIDYRPLFENFVQDLLLTVNKPEWPAAELLLSFLGTLLVQKFSNKSTDSALRISSLDCLGIVAARLRRDAVSSRLKVDKIDQIIAEIKDEEEKDGPMYENAVNDTSETKKKKKKSSKNSENTNGEAPIDEEEERTLFLERVLLDWLAVNSQGDPALLHSRHFYIGQWYRDAYSEIKRQKVCPVSPKSIKKHKKKKKKRRKDESSEESSATEDEDDMKPDIDDETKAQITQLSEKRKLFLIKKIAPFPPPSSGAKTQTLQTHIDYENAELITRYLASKRPFSQSFDMYLKHILNVLSENSIAVRTKALKCLGMVVEADPGVLARNDMQMGVNHSFLDHATSVREAAVDLVGKFVLSRPELIEKYYQMIAKRILDTGVSVRKRVIKIMKDICLDYPQFKNIPEICVKMIRRINDEEGIKKLVQEVFQNMWFTPVSVRPHLDKETLLTKVNNIAEVVITCSKETGLDWFEQLLQSMFKPKEDKDDVTKVNTEPPKALIIACKQIVDCLVNHVLVLEESANKINNENGEDGEKETEKGFSERLVACLKTLFLFAKISPSLLVDHAITLQPYLALKCQTQGDYNVIGVVARTLELVVPLMEHPSETFLAQLEEDSVKLILQHDRTVITSCLALLGSIVNTVTHNYPLIKDCFSKFYFIIVDYYKLHKESENGTPDPKLEKYKPIFNRSLYTVGLILRHFDFNNATVRSDLADNITEQVTNTLIYFLQVNDSNIRFCALQSLGSVCIRHNDLMMGDSLLCVYHNLLLNTDVETRLKTQTLLNIETYLQEEEIKMIKQDQEWAKRKTKENLKEMCDIQSGMASTIIQLYLKQILECVVAKHPQVRQSALRVVQLVLSQGLVHPVQIVPYLIAMSTDLEEVISHSADKQLQDIEKKYPGFINMKAMHGFRLSYRLQTLIQTDKPTRGYKVKEGEIPGAMNGFLYSIMRNTKQQRRAVAMSLLKQFDECARTSLQEVLFIADNLAYFPYHVIDEPLFIVYHIDVMISVAGSNLLQSFKDSLLPPPNAQVKVNPETGCEVYLDEEDDEDSTPETILPRLPADLTPLVDCIAASQNCLLLLMLKDHLKELYGITDTKLWNYSPSDTTKQYEKNAGRKGHTKFNPKGTLQRLKENAPDPSTVSKEDKQKLVEEYFAFKDMMLKIDQEELDSDDEKPIMNHHDARASTRTQRLQEQAKNSDDVTLLPETHEGWQDQDKQENGNDEKCEEEKRLAKAEEPRTPTLRIKILKNKSEIVPAKEKHRHKSSHKKKKKKKKRRISSDDDDDSEFSDPDFLV